jgi:hypothetical protein
MASKEFVRVALKQVVFLGQSTLWLMEQAMELVQHCREIAGYGQYIETSESLLLTHFASGYLGNKKATESSGTRTAKRQFSCPGFTAEFGRGSIGFATWVAILNLGVLKTDKKLKRLIETYRVYMKKVIEPKVLIWASSHPHIASPLVSLAPRMKLAFRLPYGSRLRVFLETAVIMQGFNVDVKGQGSAKWQSMYEFLMLELDKKDTMESFVVWKASGVASAIQSRRRGMLDAVMSAFATMLIDGPELQSDFDAFEPVFE